MNKWQPLGIRVKMRNLYNVGRLAPVPGNVEYVLTPKGHRKRFSTLPAAQAEADMRNAALGVPRLDPVPTEQSFDGITGRPHASGVGGIEAETDSHQSLMPRK